MKRYSEFELAEIIRKTIDLKYSDPNKVANDYKVIIKNFVKFSNKNIMLEDEMNLRILKIASAIVKDLDKIKPENIIARLSQELLIKNNREGIDIKDYDPYFQVFAKDIVKDFIQFKIAFLKKQFSTMKKNKRK